MRQIWSVTFAILLVASAPACWGATPQSASGDTPVRYVICRVGNTDCEVFARFRNRSQCEDFRVFSEMSCDHQSVPGMITCKPTPRVTGAPHGYCQE
jgi:hypothetical protein